MSQQETIKEILFSDLTEPCGPELTAEGFAEALPKGALISLATLTVDKKPNVELSVEEPSDTSCFCNSLIKQAMIRHPDQALLRRT